MAVAQDDDRPLDPDEEGGERAAQGEPRGDFSGLLSLPELPRYEARTIGRDKLADDDRALGPHRPEWLGITRRPRRAMLPRPSAGRGGDDDELRALIVFPPEDRRLYDDRSYPWGCVCRLITGAGVSSGAIVGPRHVLTASHAIDWSSRTGGSVEVHRAGGAFSAITPMLSAWAFTRITGPKVPWSQVDEDYAVVITRDRIGDRFGWLGVKTYNSRWDGRRFWSHMGYPGDMPALAPQSFPIFQQAVWLDEDALDLGGGRAMSTDADLFQGQSGGPMFANWRDGPYAVAVVSSETRRENWCAGGSDLTRLVRHARAVDP